MKELHESELLYTIALSIGNSLKLEPMLKQSLLTILRVLNCNIALVCDTHAQTVFAIPHVTHKENIDTVLHSVTQFPHYALMDGYHYHFFELPHFGTITLRRSGVKLGESLSHSLVILFNKLANACKACLYEAQLEQQTHLSNEANRAKSRFLANMSHEIRTPLNGIIGFSEILCDGELPPKELRYAQIIHSSAHSLLGIINDILDISKIEQGTIEIINEAFDFHLMSEGIVALFTAKAREKNIFLHYDVSPLIPSILIGDALKIRQIISNLLSNAIKFTPQNGSVTMSISILSQKENTVELRCSIRDSGIGIAQSAQEKIFEPFIQAQETTSALYGGTGLGLAICKELLTKMGSTIGVNSEEGKGSEFFFTLALESVSTNSTKHTHEPFTFSIIDLPVEHPEMLHSLQAYLSLWGHLVPSNAHADVSFCFGGTELIPILSQRKKESPSSHLIHINPTGEIPPALKEWVDDFLSPPLYGSKIYNKINTTLHHSHQQTEHTEDLILKAQVLVAEDNPTNQLLIQTLLNRHGIDAEIANNGQEAVDLSLQKTYDLILMDIHMPFKDGLKATEEILSLHKAPPPIVALSANAFKEDRERFLAAGMVDTLTKPIDKSELLRVLEQYLSSSVKTTHKEDIFEASKAFLGLDSQTYEMILETFKASVWENLASIEEAITLQNGEAIAQSAHYLKGACANLQFNDAAEWLKQIETMGNKRETSGYEPLIKHLYGYFDTLFS